MNRDFLKSLGMEDDAIDKVMREYGKSINEYKAKAESADGLNSQLEDLKQQLNERDEQLEELGTKAKDSEELTAEIERLKQQNEESTNEYQEKLDKQAFDFSLERELNEVGAKNPRAVRALLDVDNIKLDNSKLLGLEEQLEALKESDSYLFDVEDKKGLRGRKPHETKDKPTTLTTEQFNSMGYAERVQLKRENPDQYEKLTGRQ